MIVEPPKYIDAEYRVVSEGRPVSDFGMGTAQTVECPKPNPWVFGIIGAIVMYAVPPLISGLLSGASDAWQDRD